MASATGYRRYHGAVRSRHLWFFCFQRHRQLSGLEGTLWFAIVPSVGAAISNFGLLPCLDWRSGCADGLHQTRVDSVAVAGYRYFVIGWIHDLVDSHLVGVVTYCVG